MSGQTFMFFLLVFFFFLYKHKNYYNGGNAYFDQAENWHTCKAINGEYKYQILGQSDLNPCGSNCKQRLIC